MLPALLVVIAALIVTCLIIVHCRVRIYLLRSQLKTEKHYRARTTNFLSLFSQNISRQEDADNWMNTTARYVADLVEAQSVCIFILKGDHLEAAGIAGAFPPMRRMNSYVMTKQRYILEAIRKEKYMVGEGIIGTVAGTMDSLLISDPEDPRLQDLGSINPVTTLMAVPMMHDGDCVGVLCAVDNRRAPDKPFDSEQYGRFRFIEGQIVLAHNILTSYANLSQQQRLNQELFFARSLQSSLLPKEFPQWGTFSIHAHSRASKEVCGDFYDYIEIDQNRLLVVIGDACGKGIPACMIMAMTRSFIRAHANRFTTLKQLLVELNRDLHRDMGDGRYITLAACLLDKKESTMEYARAGHTELLVHIRKHIRSFNPDGAGLGLLPDVLADFDTISLEFAPEMELILFTDGINEAVSPFGEQFGVERIKDTFSLSCISNETPQEAVRRMLDAVDDFTEHSNAQADDQTLVIIRNR